jgi:hypothetical protein
MCRTIFKIVIVPGLLAGIVALNGCEQIASRLHGEPTPAPKASPSPTPTPTMIDSLSAAQQYLEKAFAELNSRNRRGAVELIDLAAKSLTQAAADASALLRPAINKANEALATIKTQVLTKDKKGIDSLSALERTVSALVDKAQSAADAAQMKPAAGTKKK